MLRLLDDDYCVIVIAPLSMTRITLGSRGQGRVFLIGRDGKSPGVALFSVFLSTLCG